MLINELKSSALSGFELRKRAMELLDQLDGYDWSGIYRLEKGILVLDAYVGAPTDHDKIEIGVGVCGDSVAKNKVRNVSDVRAEENYLSCSIATRSELVVPIVQNDEILGVIDIDSHQLERFDSTDVELLEEIAEILAGRWH